MGTDEAYLTIWLLPSIVILGSLLVAFVTAAEMAFASANRPELRQAGSIGKTRGQMAEALLANPARLLATFLVVKLLGLVMAVAGGVFWAARPTIGNGLPWALGLVFVLLLLAQILPRSWVIGRQNTIVLGLALPVRVVTLLLSPLTAFLQRLAQDAAPSGTLSESIFLSEDGLRFLLNVTDQESVIEQEEKEMIASIFEFSGKLVREVMVPRIDVVALPVETSIPDILDVILKVGYSRIPIYRGTADNVIGVLYAKDLLRFLRDGRTDVPPEKILRPAYFIPESKKVDELLQELQQRKVHMAIVVDEYGGTAGLVTIEDLLEEIVGEIQDEYDAEEPTVKAINANEYLFDARVPLDEANKLLAIELPDDGGDTLGGFIYSQLGKVPAVGDRIEFENVVIQVLSVAGRRIKQVRASVVPAEEVSQVSSNPRAEPSHLGASLLSMLSLF